MNDDRFEKTTEPKPYREGDARFDVTSLDEVKDENGNGIFHMTKKFKWILALSIVLLIAIGALLYAAYQDAIVAEVWQIAIWCVCAVLTFFTVAKKSVAVLILNFVLFFGVSLIPVWQSAQENFQALMKLFFG
ncbi:MAG: hypothetical protein IJS69_01175 [Selenomonadaceae bacterium]|nr:hypothetical protein [Selenomonadaceae bacterium]